MNIFKYDEPKRLTFTEGKAKTDYSGFVLDI